MLLQSRRQANAQNSKIDGQERAMTETEFSGGREAVFVSVVLLPPLTILTRCPSASNLRAQKAPVQASMAMVQGSI
jgi:hypothetical protein